MYKAHVTVDRALTLHPTRQDGSEIMMAIKSLHGHFYSMWNVGEREDVKLLLRVKLLACMMAVMRGEFMSEINSEILLTDTHHNIHRGLS